MKRPRAVSTRVCFVLCASALCRGGTETTRPPPAVILAREGAPWAVQFAAREVQRYVYLRTRFVLPITASAEKKLPAIALRENSSLPPQAYSLRTEWRDGASVLHLSGGSPHAVLNGAYAFAEKLGVRFFLHGDVIPDGRIPFQLPELNEVRKPAFSCRGLNPWGSHPFGIDLWNTDDYLVCVHQLAKLRGNFLGIHCYPEGAPYAEPTVWIGLDGEFDSEGNVNAAYPASYYNSLFRPAWGGLRPGPTSGYHLGAKELFPTECACNEVMQGMCPRPENPEECIAVFNRTACLFRRAFTFARLVGVKSCLGTESPLGVPGAVRKRLAAQGLTGSAPLPVRQIYKAVFKRIHAAHPLDYFWLWTRERWTWQGNTDTQFQAVLRDIRAAHQALKSVGRPFRLGVSGWVLGPRQDRAAFGRLLPEDIALSALSRRCGEEPIDEAFSRIHGRPRWAIPWLEGDNGGLLAVQLWVRRVLQNARLAEQYRCTGLLGLLWRTRILAPNIHALSRAWWDLPPQDAEGRSRRTDLSARAVWRDWAEAEFGPEAASAVASVFERLDGRVPRPLSRGCPAGLNPDRRPWKKVAPGYAFVDSLSSLEGKVRGAGNRSRVLYWLNTFWYLRASAKLQCAVGKFYAACAALKKYNSRGTLPKAGLKKAVSAYKEILKAYREAFTFLLQSIRTQGELATVLFWEHAIYPAAVEDTKRALHSLLKEDLLEDLALDSAYRGRPSLIVPTVRSEVEPGERLRLRVLVLAPGPKRPVGGEVLLRPIGKTHFQSVSLKHVARCVYEALLPPPSPEVTCLEYYVRFTLPACTLLWPPTAPAMNQTVVVRPLLR